MFLITGCSLTTLIAWLMMRRCKQANLDVDDGNEHQKRGKKAEYSKTSTQDDIEMTSLDDIENRF